MTKDFLPAIADGVRQNKMQPTNPNAVKYNTFVKQFFEHVFTFFPVAVPVHCRLCKTEECGVQRCEV